MKTSLWLAGALAVGLIVPTVGLVMSLAASSGHSPGTGGHAKANIFGTGSSGTGNAGPGGAKHAGGADAFVRDAGAAGQFELQSSRLAVERTRDAGVRGYAVHTLQAADDMMNRVKAINSANVGAPMATSLTAGQQASLKRLAGLTGLDFDRAYMQSQIEVGELLRKTCSDYGVHGESPAMRVYATKAVPHYEAQILQARTIAGTL